ncbi:MAG: hypothetical protein ACRYG4_01105, partial [Janthinobacterium lividum]
MTGCVKLLAALICAAAVSAASARDTAEPSARATAGGVAEARVLMVVVNGSAGETFLVQTGADGRMVMDRADLASMGVPLVAGSGDDIVLETLPGVRIAVDAAQQILRLDFATHDRRRNRIDLAPHRDTHPLTPSTTGVLVNYDLVTNHERDATTAGGLFEARLFSPLGTLSTTALANTQAIAGGGHVVRLDTGFTTTDVARLRRYTVGDFISGGLESSRSVRLAGFQVSTDFSVRPDLVTYPVPVLSGSAAVPSTVDVLVNGSRVGSGPVAAGDFAVSGAPVINGSGTVDVVVRDVLGRETRSSFAVYGVRTLLAAGLSACTADAGLVRKGYATRSNDYRFAAGTATCRVGVSDHLTVEGHGEATPGLALAGGGVVAGFGRWGVVSAGVSA